MKNECFAGRYAPDQKLQWLREENSDVSPGSHQRFQELTSPALPPPGERPSAALTRRYLRSLRAAEMAAWEMTGGDYLRSGFAAQAGHYHLV